jgi:hypothetical protein
MGIALPDIIARYIALRDALKSTRGFKHAVPTQEELWSHEDLLKVLLRAATTRELPQTIRPGESPYHVMLKMMGERLPNSPAMPIQETMVLTPEKPSLIKRGLHSVSNFLARSK